MDAAANERRCECGMPERWAAHSNVPVAFDPRMNEYHLVYEKAQMIMRYCFWCGGRLPESRRAEFFSTLDPAEQAEVRALLADARNIDDVLRVLGEPDKRCRWKDRPEDLYPPVVRWKQTLSYSERWKTFVLQVQELPDGHIAYAIAARYIGSDD
jgi:hypothetical protein